MELLFSECTDIGGKILHFIPLNIELGEYERIQKLPVSTRPIKTLLGTRLIHRMMLDLVATVVSEAMNNALLSSAPTRYCLSTNKTPVNIRLVGWNIDQGIAAGALESLSDLPREEFFMPFTLLCVTSHNFSLRYTFAKHIFEVLTEASEVKSYSSTSAGESCSPKTPLVSLWPRSCPIYRLLYRWLKRYSPEAMERRRKDRALRAVTSQDDGGSSSLAGDDQHIGDSLRADAIGAVDRSESSSQAGGSCSAGSTPGLAPLEIIVEKEERRGHYDGHLKHQFPRASRSPSPLTDVPPPLPSLRSTAHSDSSTTPTTAQIAPHPQKSPSVMQAPESSSILGRVMLNNIIRSPTTSTAATTNNVGTGFCSTSSAPVPVSPEAKKVYGGHSGTSQQNVSSSNIGCPSSTGVSFSSTHVLELQDDANDDGAGFEVDNYQTAQVLGGGGGSLFKRPSVNDGIGSTTTGNSLGVNGFSFADSEIAGRGEDSGFRQQHDGGISSFDDVGHTTSASQQPFGGPTIDIAAAGSPPRAEMARTGAEVMDLHFHVLSHWDIRTEDLCWAIEDYAQHVGFEVEESSSGSPIPNENNGGDSSRVGGGSSSNLGSPTQLIGATPSFSAAAGSASEQPSPPLKNSNQNNKHKLLWRKKVYPAPFALDVRKGCSQFKDFKPLLDAAFGADQKGHQKAGGTKKDSHNTSAIPSALATPTTALAPASYGGGTKILSPNSKLSNDSFSMLPPPSLNSNNNTAVGMPMISSGGGKDTRSRFADPCATADASWPPTMDEEGCGGESFHAANTNVGSSLHSDLDCGMSERSTSTVTFFNEEEFTRLEERAGGPGSHRITSQLYCFNDNIEECVKLLPVTCTALSLYGASGSSAAKPKFSLVKKKGDDIQVDLPPHIQWFSLSSIPSLRAITLRYATMQCIVLSSLPIFQDCFWCDGAMISLKSVHSYGLPTAAEGGGVAEAPLSSIAEAARDQMATELRGANEGWTTQRGPWATT